MVETPLIIFYIDYKIKIVIMLVFLVLQRLQKKYDYVRRYPVIVLRLSSKVKNLKEKIKEWVKDHLTEVSMDKARILEDI